MTSLVKVLQSGGVAVIRTDTLYGIVARADDESAVERIFSIKGRDRNKPLIVLLADSHQAFDETKAVDELSRQADFSTTVIVDSPHAPSWLRHNDISVGYRIPKNQELRDLLSLTGPLVAPSANPQGDEPARTIYQAKQYFGEQIDWYEDGGEVPADQAPSHIIKIKPGGSLDKLR